jgi:hypothetical protein
MAAPSVVLWWKNIWWFSSAEYRDQNAPFRPARATSPPDEIQNTSAAAPLRDLLWSNRVDYHLNPANSFSVRYSFQPLQ